MHFVSISVSFSASSYNRCKTDRKVLGNYCSSWVDDDFCRFHLGYPLEFMLPTTERIDTIVTFISSLGVTVPNFVLAMWLILIFSISLGILPMGGWGTSGSCLIDKYFCTDWILPVVAYAVAPMSIVARYTRASIVEMMGEDFVRTARAKGLTEVKVMRKHSSVMLRFQWLQLLEQRSPISLQGVFSLNPSSASMDWVSISLRALSIETIQ